jgi:hypothetical protein
MSIGGSILMIAVGAILRWGVSMNGVFGGASVNWAIVGDVLMAVGAIGLAFSLAWMASATRRAPAVDERRYDTGRPYHG